MSKTKLLNLATALVSLLVFTTIFLVPAYTAQAAPCTDANCDSAGGSRTPTPNASSADAGSTTGLCSAENIAKASPSPNERDRMTKSCVCDGTPNLTDKQIKSCEACRQGSKSCLENNRIIKDFIQPMVNFLSALVAVVVVGSIMFAGIQYALAGDKAEAVGAAKKRITTSLMAFLIFILTFAFLQWLIPGGVF